MYQQKKEVFQRTFIALDLVLTTLSFYFAYRIKTTGLSGDLGLLYPLHRYIGLFFLILPIWALMLSRAQIYEPPSTEATWKWIFRLAKALTAAFLLLVLGMFALRLQFVSRILLLLFLGINFFVLLSVHTVFRYLYRLRTHKKRPRIMVIGIAEKVRGFIDRMDKEIGVHVDISAVYLLKEDNARALPGVLPHEGWIPGGISIVQDEARIPELIHGKIIDEVFFAIRPEDLSRVKGIMAQVEEEGIVSRIIADIFEMKLSRASWDQLGTIPLVTFSRVSTKQWELFFKSVVDVSVAFFALVLSMPLCGLLAILIKRSSPGPVFFKQRRVGLRGHSFTMIKFRTMVVEAEAMRPELLQQNELTGPAFKMVADPRVTAIGRILRRHSLDELPQLLNVMVGNMSLVGPRPALPEEVAQYKPWQRRRLTMRPGITGLWQVSGRDKEDFNDWVLLDLDYIDRWKFSLDLSILAKTLPQVLLGKGA
jgi:exopolysaccharide biosynthesis polyprenyl glycosylphosphotransferase